MSKKQGKNKNKNKNSKANSPEREPLKETAKVVDAEAAEAAEVVEAVETVEETPSAPQESVKEPSVKKEPAHAAKPKKKDKDKKKDRPARLKTEKGRGENEDEQKSASPRKLVITLTAICAAVALLLAAVNHFTEAKIEENNRIAILESIRDIFDESVQSEQIDVPEGSGFTSLYLVMKDGGICGYAASVAPNGFGGPLNLMVGIDSVGAIVGVDVISMSETPGLGSRVGEEGFLSQFDGLSGNIKVDAISGATISSTAVADGVNTVTANLLDLALMAAERGLAVVPYVRGAAPAETTAKAPVVPDAPATTAPETKPDGGAPSVTKNDAPPDVIVPNPGDGKTGIYADYVEDTTEFETITTEPESSDLETTVTTAE